MELMTVDVRVGPILKEYIIASSGSDVLVPEKDTVLWALLKQHLVTCPTTYVPITDRTEYIQIALRTTKAAATYSVVSERKLLINTLFRSFLTNSGQNVIRRHFAKEFKKSFRDYMKGALNNNSSIQIKDAIEKFCEDNKVTMNKISYEMLKKDWYRFSKKNNAQSVCTLIF